MVDWGCAESKALLLGAVFLIDFMFFEKAAEPYGGGGGMGMGMGMGADYD